MPDGFDFQDLQRRFVEATDFADFWTHFLDNYAENPAFMRLGGPAETQQMEVLVAYITGKMLGKVVEPEGMRLAKIPEVGVVHGACFVDGEITCVLYFETIEKGLVVHSKAAGQTNFARFTWTFKPPPPQAAGSTMVN